MNQDKIDQLLAKLVQSSTLTEIEVDQITEQIFIELTPLIEKLVHRWASIASIEDQQDYVSKTKVLILERIRSAQKPIEMNSSYVGLKVKEAIHGGDERKQRNRVESQVSKQFDQNQNHEWDNYQQQDPNPTPEGFQRYRAEQIREQVNQISNQPETIGSSQESGEIDLADTSSSIPEIWDGRFSSIFRSGSL